MKSVIENEMSVLTIFAKISIWSQIKQIREIFNRLKLWVAVAR